MLILNAGILYPSDPSFTQYDPVNGLCRAFKTNYLGHFVLQKELEHALLHTGRVLAIEAKQGAQTARIVTVGSDAHRLGPFHAYQIGDIKKRLIHLVPHLQLRAIPLQKFLTRPKRTKPIQSSARSEIIRLPRPT